MMTKKVPVRLMATNLVTGAVVANRVDVAANRVDRAVGLLSRRSLDDGEGLFITPCRGVHTWFMRFPIDVLALSEDGVVVDAVSNLGPWRMRLPRRGGVNVLELPAGSLSRSKTEVGHRIEMKLAPTREVQ
jgi:uncharacterized membrane protein (UPF0127 family)